MTVSECEGKRASARSCVCGNPAPGTPKRIHGNTPLLSNTSSFIALAGKLVACYTVKESAHTSQHVHLSHAWNKGGRFSSKKQWPLPPVCPASTQCRLANQTSFPPWVELWLVRLSQHGRIWLAAAGRHTGAFEMQIAGTLTSLESSFYVFRTVKLLLIDLLCI